jgi:hypothetical protein
MADSTRNQSEALPFVTSSRRVDILSKLHARANGHVPTTTAAEISALTYPHEQVLKSQPGSRADQQQQHQAKNTPESKNVSKEIKEGKETKEIKEAKESKDQKENKEHKEQKDKEGKEGKEHKEHKESKENKEQKEHKDGKESKEFIKDTNKDGLKDSGKDVDKDLNKDGAKDSSDKAAEREKSDEDKAGDLDTPGPERHHGGGEKSKPGMGTSQGRASHRRPSALLARAPIV